MSTAPHSPVQSRSGLGRPAQSRSFGAGDGGAAIDRVALYRLANEQPERSLLAGVVVQALEDASTGDASAVDWLAGPACLALLAQLAPDGDARQLQGRLLDLVDATGGDRSFCDADSEFQE
jgi:hypothetical protein